MKRRSFGLLAGTSTLAAMSGGLRANAATADASQLTTTLTPFGAERAGNAAGSIPAWTGGFTQIPASSGWDPTKTLPPDFFASDKMLYKVDASNMAQYADKLSPGVQALMKQRGFYINVYPTRRTQAATQWVYDNMAKNVTRATPQGGDYRLGFNGAYGGIPFPILDKDPGQAGAQAIWNSQCKWFGPYQELTNGIYTNANGTPVLASSEKTIYKWGLYQQGVNPADFNHHIYDVWITQLAPANVAGGQAIGVNSCNPVKVAQMSWQLLAGQGRVRRTPNLQFDTPSSYDDGIIDYDEQNGFQGPLYKYDWKLLGKTEFLIPYNSNSQFSRTGPELHMKDYFDPQYMRWELHRCWMVEATLHPGERNVLATRKFWIDEDTWIIGVTDSYDANNSLIKVQYSGLANFPNLPGTLYQVGIVYNVQTGQYVSTGGSYANPPMNAPWTFHSVPDSLFDPTSMAAAAAY